MDKRTTNVEKRRTLALRSIVLLTARAPVITTGPRWLWVGTPQVAVLLLGTPVSCWAIYARLRRRAITLHR